MPQLIVSIACVLGVGLYGLLWIHDPILLISGIEGAIVGAIVTLLSSVVLLFIRWRSRRP